MNSAHHSPFSFRVVDQVSSAGAALNEDGLIATKSGAWVVDGASGLADACLTPGATDAQWLMESVIRHLGDDSLSDPVQTLGVVADRVFSEFDALGAPSRVQQYEYPSASLVGCSLIDDILCAVRLGDCTLLLQSPSGGDVYKFSRSPLRDLDDVVIAEMITNQQQNHMTGSVAYRSVLPRLRANRNLINEEDGYGALTVGKNRTLIPDVLTIPINEPMYGLLCSDGFWRLVDTFHVYTERTVLEACASVGLMGLVAELRLIENNDPDGRLYPRLKLSDDATALFFRLLRE